MTYGNVGSGNGLLPDGTNPLPEPVLTNHQWGLMAFIWGQFHRKCFHSQSHSLSLTLSLYLDLSIFLLDMSLRFTNLWLQPHLSGPNELKRWPRVGLYVPWWCPLWLAICMHLCIHMCVYLTSAVSCLSINTLRPRQNGHHFTDDIFKCIFWNENVWILPKISLDFVPKVPINNIPALDQIMAWRQAIIRTNDSLFTDAYIRHSASMS